MTLTVRTVLADNLQLPLARVARERLNRAFPGLLAQQGREVRLDRKDAAGRWRLVVEGSLPEQAVLVLSGAAVGFIDGFAEGGAVRARAFGGAAESPEYLKRVAAALARVDPDEVGALADALHACYEQGRMIFVVGNGGSGANASHFCEDLGKGTLGPEGTGAEHARRFRVLSLTDNTPYLTAWANDEGFERVFVEQLKNLAAEGDLLVALSGSGDSPNILAAVDWANRQGLMTFGLTGNRPGSLRGLAQKCLCVPSQDMGVIETAHLAVIHAVVAGLGRRCTATEEPPPF